MSPRALLTLSVLQGRYAICRLQSKVAVPAWATEGEFSSITRTKDELSIVCPENNVPGDITFGGGWRVLRCEGPLHFGLTGVIASLADPLADAQVAIFPIATHDTDYLLVKEQSLDDAIHALTSYGHAIRV